MDWFIKAFVRASLLWLAAGIVLGVAIGLQPAWVVYRPAHAHMTVAGFLTLFVFGVGYQLLPRMFGHPLKSRGLAIAHLWLANLGLGGMVAGFLVRPHGWMDAQWLMVPGALLYGLGALLWVGNLWRTFDTADARARARAGGGASLPTVDP